MLSEQIIKKVQVICPICKVKEIVNLPFKFIKNSSHLTTVSIPKGKICDHHFQIFIDKAFNIRGYQKVDFELDFNKISTKNTKNAFMNGLKLYERRAKEIIPRNNTELCSSENKNEQTLSKIYQDFWEFIDDDNETFQKYVLKDKRRRDLLSKTISATNYRSQLNKILQKTS